MPGQKIDGTPSVQQQCCSFASKFAWQELTASMWLRVPGVASLWRQHPMCMEFRQPISRGRVARPREWEIPVHDPVGPDKAPRPPPPLWPPATSAPEPVLVSGDAPQAERGDPGTTLQLTNVPQFEVPMEFERQARSRWWLSGGLPNGVCGFNPTEK